MIIKSSLLYLSRSERLKKLLTRFSAFNKVTSRFVAGEDAEEAVNAIRVLNGKGLGASFDHLGEAIKSKAETANEVREYLRILDLVKQTGIDSNVSVKLTQLGLDVNPELCYENVRTIVEAAARLDNFVRIDMEDSDKTDRTIQIFKRLRNDFENVGIVIQAYLHRSVDDVVDLIARQARIRLCKGAYDEPASVAFPKKADVDANFVKLARMLLESTAYHGIATHDVNMIEAVKQFAKERSIGPDRFEFQMLYGVRRDLQEELVSEGYRVRVYVPYGRHWYPYFVRRLAERPANIWFVLKNLLKA